jgi:hypothetical protein
VPLGQFRNLISQKKIGPDTFVWTKGFDNWKKLKEIKEFEQAPIQAPPLIKSIPVPEVIGPDWESIADEERIFHIKIGHDRGGSEIEYGPYSINDLKIFLQEKRINQKTYVYTPGMENWSLLADIPVYGRFNLGPAKNITEKDRRQNLRRPFVARILFHDNKKIFQGICRDISIGGMQILIADFPGKMGEQINLNVHPENTDYSFTADGEIVRVLEGNQGFSIRFNELKQEAQNAILKYLSQNK